MLYASSRVAFHGTQLVLQAKRKTGAYHGQMNFENFRRWFVERLLPQIPAASLIVMDNAPYHNVYIDGVFYATTSSKKAELQSWLEQHHPEAHDRSMIRAELRRQLQEGFDKVTPDICQAAIADMRTEENRYWKEDMEQWDD